MIRTCIGIQARLSSTRLKGKAFMEIHGKTMVDHILDRVSSSIGWFSRNEKVYRTFDMCLLVPKSEILEWKCFQANSRHDFWLISGPMGDVFRRYETMVDQFNPDYVMRLTADCPFIPSPLISKMANIAIKNRFDYMTNTFQEFRTMLDGHDCEIMSSRCFKWLRKNIDDGDESDREHVTTYLKKNCFDIPWMKLATLTTGIDMSQFKFSIDTKEEFDEIVEMHEKKMEKDFIAKKKGISVYEF